MCAVKNNNNARSCNHIIFWGMHISEFITMYSYNIISLKITIIQYCKRRKNSSNRTFTVIFKFTIRKIQMF